MTYQKAMQKVFALLGETKPSELLKQRVLMFLNDGQREVALYDPLFKSARYEAEDDKSLPADCRRPVWVITKEKRFQYRPNEPLPEAFTLEYEAVPTDAPAGAGETAELTLRDEALPAVLYYAGAMAKFAEDDQRAFTALYALYQGKLTNLNQQPQRPVGTVVTMCTSL